VQERIEELVKLALKTAGASHSTPLMYDGFDFSKLNTSLKFAMAAENSKLIAKQVS